MLQTLRIAVSITMVLGSFVAVASAQTTGGEPGGRLPVVTFGAGMGLVGSGEIVPSIVVQRSLSPRLVVEVDGLRWSRTESREVSTTINGTQTFHRQRSGWAVGASLLFRTRPRRASWFGGGGVAFLETFEHDRYVMSGCTPRPSDPYICDRLTFSTNKSRSGRLLLRALTGADVRMVGPLSAYGLFEVAEGFTRFSGGLRVTVRSRDAAPAREDRSPGSTARRYRLASEVATLIGPAFAHW